MESDFRPSDMEKGLGIAPMNGDFDQEVITQSEQAGPNTNSIATQSVTQSAEVHKEQRERYSRPRHPNFTEITLKQKRLLKRV